MSVSLERDMSQSQPEVPSAARLKVVACVAGVSIERGVPPEEIHDYIREADNLVWVDVQDPGPHELAMLEEEFGFHPLALEDIAKGERRPKVREYKGYIFVVSYCAVPDQNPEDLQAAEVDVFIGRNFIVTIHFGPVPALDEALSRWTRSGPMLSEGVGYLVYTVMDAIIDAYFPLIEAIEEEVDEIEINLFTRFDQEAVRNLLRLKRTLVALRRVLYPLRDIFQVFMRRDHPFFKPTTLIYLQDVYDHILRMLDILETEREMVAGALEASLTVMANRLNATMKRLAIITVAVAVIGSVFGAYGMNFASMPLADEPWGFWAISGGTLALLVTSMVVCWWKGWW